MPQRIDLNEAINHISNESTPSVARTAILAWLDTVFASHGSGNQIEIKGPDLEANRIFQTELANLPIQQTGDLTANLASEAETPVSVKDRLITLVASLAFAPADHRNLKVMHILENLEDLSMITTMLKDPKISAKAIDILSCISPNSELFPKAVDAAIQALIESPHAFNKQTLARMGGGQDYAMDTILQKLDQAITNLNREEDIEVLLSQWGAFLLTYISLIAMHKVDKGKILDQLEANLISSDNANTLMVSLAVLAIIGPNDFKFLDDIDKLKEIKLKHLPINHEARELVEANFASLKRKKVRFDSGIEQENIEIAKLIEQLASNNSQTATAALLEYKSLRGKSYQSHLIRELTLSANAMNPDQNQSTLDNIADLLQGIINSQPESDEHQRIHEGLQDLSIQGPKVRTQHYILSQLTGNNPAQVYLRAKLQAQVA